jgi:hypothetical protein
MALRKPKHGNKVILAMQAAGFKVTPATLLELRSKVPPSKHHIILAIDCTLAELEAHQPPEQPRPATPATSQFAGAATEPLSNGAGGALQDRIRARHRPGGRMMPRPRWSPDEQPRAGWDHGEVAPRRGLNVFEQSEVWRQQRASEDEDAEMLRRIAEGEA